MGAGCFRINVNDEQSRKVLLSIPEINKNQLHNSICKIKSGNKVDGLGIFCKIPVSNSKEFYPVLIVSTEIIDKAQLKSGSHIKFSFINEMDSHEITINNTRKIYYNEDKYNIVIIEIKEDDKLEIDSFLEFETDKANTVDNLNKKDSIGLITINKENKFESVLCNLNNVNNNGYDIIYKSDIKQDLLFYPIVNLINYKLIGIHYKKDKSRQTNSGKLLENIFDDYIKNDKALRPSKSLNKEIIIIYGVDNTDFDRVKIFGEEFVKNNKDKFVLLVNEKIHELCVFLRRDEITIVQNLFKIGLVQTQLFTNMSHMFEKVCCLLSVLNISDLNTEHVNNMSGLFFSCTGLQEIPNLGYLNTSEVTDMSFMFESCTSLRNIADISNWNTSKVKTMKAMFESCESLFDLPDISNWDMSNVTDVSYMFNFCFLLKSLPDISKWNTSNFIDMSHMFKLCTLVSTFPDISNWDTKNVKSLCGTFNSLTALRVFPDISNWNTSKCRGYLFNFWKLSKFKFYS